MRTSREPKHAEKPGQALVPTKFCRASCSVRHPSRNMLASKLLMPRTTPTHRSGSGLRPRSTGVGPPHRCRCRQCAGPCRRQRGRHMWAVQSGTLDHCCRLPGVSAFMLILHARIEEAWSAVWARPTDLSPVRGCSTPVCAASKRTRCNGILNEWRCSFQGTKAVGCQRHGGHRRQTHALLSMLRTANGI